MDGQSCLALRGWPKNSDVYALCFLKGTATLLISILYMKALYKPWILMPVSSKLVEKNGSYGRLNNCKLTLMEAAIL